MKLFHLNHYAQSNINTTKISSAISGKTVYVSRAFLPTNAENYTEIQKATRALLSVNQLEILSCIQNHIFMSLDGLEMLYNIMGSDLPELPPINEDGELDYSGCPKPFSTEILSLTANGAIRIVDWDDDLSVKLFYEDIKDLSCYAFFSDKEEADSQKKQIKYIMKGENLTTLFCNTSCSEETFKKWIGVLCQGTVQEVFDLLSKYSFGINQSQRNFVLKVLVHFVFTDSMMLCDASFINPIYGTMRGYKILPDLKAY